MDDPFHKTLTLISLIRMLSYYCSIMIEVLSLYGYSIRVCVICVFVDAYVVVIDFVIVFCMLLLLL